MWNLHERQFRHAATRSLLAGGRGEGRAEHGDARNAAAFDFDGISDADRGRGPAIAEALHDRVALRQICQIALGQSILGRGLADDRTMDRREAIGKLRRQPLDEEVGVALAVVDKAEALAANVG